MAELRFCSSLHCVQNLNSGFLKDVNHNIFKQFLKNLLKKIYKTSIIKKTKEKEIKQI